MSFRVTILGSSGALPAHGRFPSSQYLNIEQDHFLIDCGEGAQLQLKKYDVPQTRINHIFISHLHGDHYLGLMGLIFSMHLLHRESDLHLHAFRGLDEIIRAQLKHASSSLNFKLHFHPLRSERDIIFQDDLVTVETIPMRHKIPTCGFLFREQTKSLRINKDKLPKNIRIQDIVQLKKGEDVINENREVVYRASDYTLPARRSRSYACCSDTEPYDEILEQLHGVDLLYHEATFLEDEKSKARETRHSTAAEAATVAKRCEAGKLILGHFSARYKDLEPVLAEAQRIFPNTALAREGETFEIAD